MLKTQKIQFKKLIQIAALVLTALILFIPTTVDASELSQRVITEEFSSSAGQASVRISADSNDSPSRISRGIRPIRPMKVTKSDLQISYFYDEDCNLHIVITNVGTEPVTIGGENNPNIVGMTLRDGTKNVIGSGNALIPIEGNTSKVVLVIPADFAAQFVDISVDPSDDIEETYEGNNWIPVEPCNPDPEEEEVEGGNGPTGPVVECDMSTDTNIGEQCLRFIPNQSGGYDVEHEASTDDNGNSPLFLGVKCETSKNGNRIEYREVEHILGTQGNFVEYGFVDGEPYQTGTTPMGIDLPLPTSVPNDGATYERECWHWVDYTLETTNVTVTLP